MSDYDKLIEQIADDWCSGADVLREKRNIAFGDIEKGAAGCSHYDFKSRSLNNFLTALSYYEARWYSCLEQHALVYADMLAVLAERPKFQAKHADLAEIELRVTAACMQDEPGPEDARFGEHDDMYDALHFAVDALHKINFGAAPARTEVLYYNPPGTPTSHFGESTVSTTSLSFTTVNYVSINNGPPIDLSKLPADNIFSLIEQTEAEIKRLNEIANKPKALVARIESLQSGIERLVAEIDGRDE